LFLENMALATEIASCSVGYGYDTELCHVISHELGTKSQLI